MDLPHLEGMTTLEQLDVMADFTDAGLRQLKGLTNLQRIDVTRCDSITDAGAAELSRRCPTARYSSSPRPHAGPGVRWRVFSGQVFRVWPGKRRSVLVGSLTKPVSDSRSPDGLRFTPLNGYHESRVCVGRRPVQDPICPSSRQ